MVFSRGLWRCYGFQLVAPVHDLVAPISCHSIETFYNLVIKSFTVVYREGMIKEQHFIIKHVQAVMNDSGNFHLQLKLFAKLQPQTTFSREAQFPIQPIARSSDNGFNIIHN
jgi:hypothetical protein